MTVPSHRIVVVEDDVGMSHAIARVLSAGGMKPELFVSAEELLANDAAGEAICFVVDIGLPGMSGLKLVGELNDRGEHGDVIFITADDDPKIRIEAERLGAKGYLPKPFLGSVLLESVKQIVDGERTSR